MGRKPAKHHKLLIKELEHLWNTPGGRLAVFMPPGSAKSTYSSQIFPAWIMAQGKGLNVLAASYSMSLAENFSRKTQAIVTDNTKLLGYGLTRENAEQWETSNGCSYRAAGVGGAITGFRADIAIIDDPVKGRDQAESSAYRETTWDWYNADLQTRAKPGLRVLIVQCMVGDTAVTMADGSRKKLRDLAVGDEIATYEGGALSASRVEAWASQGEDEVLEITTASGAKTKANARHPFLVEREGRLQWIKLRDLTTGDKMVRRNGEPTPTSDFVLDAITAITPAGTDEVFDVQVARTENFIADGFVSHNTRWHEDDLGGRILTTQRDNWRVVSLPATAIENDPIGRQPGELLWEGDPDWPYAAELRQQKANYEATGAMRDWNALFEQDPRPGDGGIFQAKNLVIQDYPTAGAKIVRAWDFAATEQTGTRDPDWTVGVKMQREENGRYTVLDVVRFRGGPDEVERRLKQVTYEDGKSVRVSLPQDPGQAGKSQILYFTRLLAGYAVASSPETGDKATRAMPFAAQVNVGNVSILRAAWNAAYADELGGFPAATKDDQVDASSRAFNTLVSAPAPIRRAHINFMGR